MEYHPENQIGYSNAETDTINDHSLGEYIYQAFLKRAACMEFSLWNMIKL